MDGRCRATSQSPSVLAAHMPNAAEPWHCSKYYAPQRMPECYTGPVPIAEGAQATSAMAQNPKELAMPSTEFQQIHKDGSKDSRPLSAPNARKDIQHVTFVDEPAVPRHQPGDQDSKRGEHTSNTDSCTQWSQEDSWEAQRRSLAATRRWTARTAARHKVPQTHGAEDKSHLLWYTRTYTESERTMLATWAQRNDLSPMPDLVPPPKAAPKEQPPGIFNKAPPSQSKSWQ